MMRNRRNSIDPSLGPVLCRRGSGSFQASLLLGGKKALACTEFVIPFMPVAGSLISNRSFVVSVMLDSQRCKHVHS